MISFIIGLAIGSFIGMLIMGLCVSASIDDRNRGK